MAACALVLGSVAVSAQIANGDYYIQNVSSGLYLCGENNWGTQASVAPQGVLFTLTNNNGSYSILHTGVTATNKYLGSNYYTDSTNPGWTIAEVDGEEGVYTIKTGENYLAQTETGGAYTGYLAGGVNSVTDAAKWYILTKAEAIAKLSNATLDNPLTASFLIKNPGFNRNISTSSWTMAASNQTLSGGGDNNRCAESYHAVFTLTQTITGVPNGVYELTAQGFYRQDGNDNTNLPYFYLNSGKQTFPVKSGSENNMADASNSFTNGSYTISPIRVTVTDGTITLGAKNESNTNLWCIFDNFQLKYYGVDLSAYEETINELRSALNDLLTANEPMNATVKSDAQSLYNSTASVAQTQNDMETAITDLNNAITAINTSVDYYAALKVYLDQAASFDAAGQASFNADADAATLKTAYENNSFETLTSDNITALKAALKTAALAQTTVGADFTLAITNPSFEDGFSGWTSNGLGAQTNTSFQLKDGNAYVESWQPNGTKSVKQTITGLPAGVYNLSVGVLARGVTSAKIYAAGVEKAITIGGNAYTESVEFACDANADIEIGFEGTGTGAGSSWLALDNFKLTLVSAGLPDVTAVTGKMNATVAQAQTDAIDAYNAGKTVAGYNAAQAAIAAAQASVNAYAAAAAAIAAAKALQTNNNFVTTAAATTFAGAIAAIETQYNENTLTNDDATAAGTTLGVVAVGWHSAATNTQASNYMISTWPGTLTVNDWSVEGESDGSNFLVPFFQDWIADGESLATKKLTGTLTGLENGLYEVSAWVRVRAKDETSAADATGITMDVNGGGEGDYAAIDVTEGTQVGSTQFQLGNYTAQGLVKDGNLSLNFNVNDGNNISWLSFKNISYTKVRDLTEEESAVKPTAIELDKATAELYVGKTLTLTPTFTPANATTNSTWESSDETVATVSNEGVVTALKYGTATITMTSTIDTEVSASCEVTVTAPLFSAAENLDFAEGPVATTTVVTYEKDKGTGKAQMQPVTGWTIVTNGDARATSVMEYNSGLGLGSATNLVPTAGPEGTNGKVLGIVAVWDAVAQYTQAVRMPAGAYTITLPIYNEAGTAAIQENLIGFIEDSGTKHFATTTNYAGGSWTTEIIKFTLNEETFGKLSLGYDGQNVGNGSAPHLWIDRMTITLEPFATDAEIAALDAAIADAEGKTLGFDEGEYAPYNNVAALKALAAAKAIDTTNPVGQSAVTGATAALTGATWTANTEEVNAVYDGLFTIQTVPSDNTRPLGWSRHSATANASDGTDGGYETRLMTLPNGVTTSNVGMMTKFHAFYGDQTGYTMPLEAETYYTLSFKYTGWGNSPTMHVNVYSEDGTRVAQSDNFTATQGGDTDASKWTEFSYIFKTTDAGNYVIGLIKNSGGTQQDQSGFTEIKLYTTESIEIDETDGYTVVENAQYANVTFNRTLVEGWNGMVLPFDMSVDDVKATFNASKVKDFKSVTVTDGKATLEFEDATVVKAGKPFMMKADEAGTSYTINGVLLPAAGLQTVSQESGDVKYTFTGSYAATTDLSSVVFALIQGDKYYYHNTGKSSSAKAFRAWFVNESTDEAGSRISFNFGDDVITGINEVQTNGQDAEAVYNLQGQRVVNAKKGLFIQNGKKVVIK